MLPGPCRLLPPAGEMENGTRPKSPEGRISSAVCGSLAEARYREYLLDVLLTGETEEKADIIIGLREGCGTDWKKEYQSLQRQPQQE